MAAARRMSKSPAPGQPRGNIVNNRCNVSPRLAAMACVRKQAIGIVHWYESPNMAVALDSFGWFGGFYDLMIPAPQRRGYGVGRPLTPKLGEGALDERVERSGRVLGFFPRPSVR